MTQNQAKWMCIYAVHVFLQGCVMLSGLIVATAFRQWGMAFACAMVASATIPSARFLFAQARRHL